MKQFRFIIPIILTASVFFFALSASASSGIPFDPLLPAFPSGLQANVDYSLGFYGDRLYFLVSDGNTVYQVPSRVTWSAEKNVDPNDPLIVDAEYTLSLSGFLPINGSYQNPTTVCVLFPSDVIGLLQLTDQFSADGLTCAFSHDIGYFRFENPDSSLAVRPYNWLFVSHNGNWSIQNARLPDGTFYFYKVYLTIFDADSATDSINLTLTVQSPYGEGQYEAQPPIEVGAPGVGGFLNVVKDFFSMFAPIFESKAIAVVGTVIASGVVLGLVVKLVL